MPDPTAPVVPTDHGSARGSTGWWIGAAAGVVLALAAAAIAFAVIRHDPASAVQVRLIAADDPGADPFVADLVAGDRPGFRTEPVATQASDEDSPDAIEVTATVGTDDGVYGSTSDATICDVDAMAAALADDPSAAGTWADLEGVEVTQISSTLSSFAPVVLGADVLVTNTGYRSGTPHRFQAVLQAGTAVLVDSFGRPRVKCGCANPLLPAELEPGDDASTPVQFEGEPWTGFSPDDVAVIQAAEDPVTDLSTVDVDSGDEASVAVASTVADPAAAAGYLRLTPERLEAVDPGGRSTTLVDHAVADAWDDGAGGVIFQDPRTSTEGLYTEVHNRAENPPGSDDEGAIWILRPGSTQPEVLVGSDLGGAWPVLVAAGPLGDRRMLFYLQATGADSAPLVALDLDRPDEPVVVDSDVAVWSTFSMDGTRVGSANEGETLLWDGDLRPVDSAVCPGGRCPVDLTLVGGGLGAAINYTEESVESIDLVSIDDGQRAGTVDDLERINLSLGGYSVQVDGAGGRMVMSYVPDLSGLDLNGDALVDAAATAIDLASPSADTSRLDPGTYRVLRAPLERP